MEQSGEQGRPESPDEEASALPAFPRLLSRHELTIDGKNRLVLPSSHRARYKAGVVCSPRGDHLGIYEPAEWDRHQAELMQACRGGRLDRDVFNWITANSVDPTPDNAGRILIPRWLRDEVGIEGDDIVLAGHGDYFGVHRGDYLTTVDPAIRVAAAASLNALGL